MHAGQLASHGQLAERAHGECTARARGGGGRAGMSLANRWLAMDSLSSSLQFRTSRMRSGCCTSWEPAARQALCAAGSHAQSLAAIVTTTLQQE